MPNFRKYPYPFRHGVGIAVNAHQNRLVACYLDYSSLSVTDPNELVVEDTFFLGVPAVFVSAEATTLQGVRMSGNTYNTGGAGPDSIHVDPKFVDGEDCAIYDDIAPPGHTLQATRASATVAHLETAVTQFSFSFPQLLLPRAATSTLFWTIFHPLLSSLPPYTRHGLCSTLHPC